MGMGAHIPYEPKPIGGIQVGGGSSVCVPVDFPSRSIISKIICIQNNGTPVAFTIDIFNSENACQGLSESDSEGSDTGGLPPDLYRVTPTLNSQSAGRFLYFTDKDGGVGYEFFSQDHSRLGNKRKLFVKISPEGSGPKEFTLALGGLSM